MQINLETCCMNSWSSQLNFFWPESSFYCKVSQGLTVPCPSFSTEVLIRMGIGSLSWSICHCKHFSQALLSIAWKLGSPADSLLMSSSSINILHILVVLAPTLCNVFFPIKITQTNISSKVSLSIVTSINFLELQCLPIAYLFIVTHYKQIIKYP